MKLYEINQEILDCIDQETGEILDSEKLEKLQIDRHEKLRNYAFLVINLSADVDKFKAQEDKFKARRKKAENTIEWAKQTLSRELEGKEMEEDEFRISYLPSEAVEIDETMADKIPFEFWKEQKPSFDKNALKKAIKEGQKIEGVRLVERNNIQIK
ncbi:virus Gp157 [Anaerovibrio lipolyticus DSM 3074]|uniref:Virus Gp157 n=1 Tax=Anaerovibrio lipolyticus DSM 3074 TaxID=1120997 RepID=A0A1M6C4S4_9FIRM|nr:siphovirus Gp157 family protein [Anaerovibrio lipolyticus]SHI56019.1 virus Gp157 [Anaerovibrio lipolyticus DSM 3074]